MLCGAGVFHRRAGLALCQAGFGLNQARIGLRVGLELGGQALGQLQGRGDASSARQDQAGRPRHLSGRTRRQRLLRFTRRAGRVAPGQQRIGPCHPLHGHARCVLGGRVRGDALVQRRQRVGDPALIEREVGQARTAKRRAGGRQPLQLLVGLDGVGRPT